MVNSVFFFFFGIFLRFREPRVEDNISTISEILKRLHLSWPRLEPLFHLLQKDIHPDCEDIKTSLSSGKECIHREGKRTKGNMQ